MKTDMYRLNDADVDAYAKMLIGPFWCRIIRSKRTYESFEYPKRYPTFSEYLAGRLQGVFHLRLAPLLGLPDEYKTGRDIDRASYERACDTTETELERLCNEQGINVRVHVAMIDEGHIHFRARFTLKPLQATDI